MSSCSQGSATNPRIPGIPGIHFRNLGSGIGTWDSFTKNPGFGIPGSQIADPWLFRQVGLARPVQEFTLVLDVVHFDRVILNN